MDLDKNQAEKRLLAFFGDNFESYNLNLDSNNNQIDSLEYLITKKEILNPKFENYLKIYEMFLLQKHYRPDTIGGNKYNSLLHILSVITECIPLSILEEWDNNPRLLAIKKITNN